MTKTEYREYIASTEWQERRRAFLAADVVCAICELPRWLAEIVYGQDLHVHHKSYANLGREQDDDLQPLCRRCHEIETFGRSELIAPKEATCERCGARHWDYRSGKCQMCSQIFYGVKFYDLLERDHEAWSSILTVMARHCANWGPGHIKGVATKLLWIYQAFTKTKEGTVETADIIAALDLINLNPKRT